VPLMPLLAEVHEQEPIRAGEIAGRLLRILMVAVLPIGVGVALSSRFLLTLLYGGTYADADRIASLLVLAGIYVSITPVVSSLLLGSGRTLAVLGLDSFWAATFVPTSLLLIDRIGLLGIGFAHLASRGLLALIMLVYLRRTAGIRLQPLIIPAAYLVIVTLTSLALVLALEATTQLLLALPVTGIAAGVGALILTREERRMLARSARDILTRN
jgi:O-antigen/teichoic acid export membrane protein